MTTYYHVADESYNIDEDLYCWDELEQMGQTPAYKWGGNQEVEDYIDTDVVCLFSTLEEAEDFQLDHDGQLLKIELPERPEELNIMITTVGEGYTAIAGRIPAEYIFAQ